MPTELTLTPKQSQFCRHFLNDAGLNATEAARLSGYKFPMQEGHRLRSHPAVTAHIQEALEARAMPVDEVLARLSDIARGSLDDFIDLEEIGTDEDGNPIVSSPRINLVKARRRGVLHTFESIEFRPDGGIKLKRYSALHALETLAKIHALFSDQAIEQEVTQINVILSALPPAYARGVCAALGIAVPAAIPAEDWAEPTAADGHAA